MQISILELLMSQIELSAPSDAASASPSASSETVGLFAQLLEQLSPEQGFGPDVLNQALESGPPRAPDDSEEASETSLVGLTTPFALPRLEEGVFASSGGEPPDAEGLEARPLDGKIVLGETSGSPPSVAGSPVSEASRIGEFFRGPTTPSLEIGGQPVTGSAGEAELDDAATAPKPESNASLGAPVGRGLPFLGGRADSELPAGGQPGLMGQTTRQDGSIRELLASRIAEAESSLAEFSRPSRGSANEALEGPVNLQDGLRSLAKTAGLLEAAGMQRHIAGTRRGEGPQAKAQQLGASFANKPVLEVASGVTGSPPFEAEPVSSFEGTARSPAEAVKASAATTLAASSAIVRSVAEADAPRSEQTGAPAPHGVARPAEVTIRHDRASVEPTARAPVERVGEAVVRSVQYLAGRDGEVIRIRLIPASLGEVNVVVKTHGQSMNVHLAVASIAVREALELQLPGLQDALNREGFDVTRVTVSTGLSHDATTQGGLARQNTHGGLSQPHGEDRPETGPHRHGEPRAMTGHMKQHDGTLDVLV